MSAQPAGDGADRTVDYQRDFYDRHYAQRASILREQLDHALFADFHRRLAERILARRPAGSGTVRIVEQACGEGLLAAAFGDVCAAEGLELDYLGADVSAAAAEAASRALPAGRFEAGEAVAHMAGVAEGSADLIVAKNLLHHLVDPVALLEAGRRALAPGGRFVAVEPTRGSAQAWVFNLLAPRRERYWFVRGPQVVRGHFEAAGLRVVAEERFSFFPYELGFTIRPGLFRRALHPEAPRAARVGEVDDRLAERVPALANYRLWVAEEGTNR
ncbi:MAG TPA: methyltransferase domain-containing protein [Acidimicrobiales bacterium]|nr:methyltransferase domain-containing protein [Acidimicrobiales bacterium]